MHEFRQLKIRITPDGAGGFRTDAEGPTGEAHGTFEKPFTDLELGTLIGKVGRARQDARSGVSPDLALVKDFGGKLFQALFREKIRDLYRDELRSSEEQGERLRITLALTDVPLLMQIPWEFLYDEPNLLSIWTETSVVRYLDLLGGKDPLTVEPPLRILAMVSNPSDPGLAPLDAQAEREKVDAALKPLRDQGAVQVTWLEKATREEFISHTWQGQYHVFHYIGHGDFDQQRQQGLLFFETAEGGPDDIEAETLATLLDQPSLRLVVLNSCEGARTSPDDPFTGVASRLVRQKIPAVVAMQFEITDRAAILFAWGLYGALAAGFPIDSALTQARRAILIIDENELEWGTPVLFMRVPDGRIFDVSSDTKLDTNIVSKPKLPPKPKPERRPRIRPALAALWSRWRLRAGVAAVAVFAAVAALAYALWPNGSNEWAQVDAGAAVLDGSGPQKIQGVTKLPQNGAVAVGRSGAAPTVWNFDGSSWFRSDLNAERGVMNAVVFSQGSIFAVGSRRVNSDQWDAVAWLRPGAGKWRSVCVDCGNRGRQVAFAAIGRRDGSFVAVGRYQGGADYKYDAAVWQSSDGGATWRRFADTDPDLAGENSQVMLGLVDAGDRRVDRLIAVGHDGKDAAVWTSTDGSDWERVSDSDLTASTGFLEMTSVTKLGTRVVAVGWEQPGGGQKKAAAWISYDRGSTWKRGGGDFAARDQQMRDVTAVGTELVAVGNDNAVDPRAAVWSSVEGLTWTAVRSGSFGGEGIVGMTSVAFLDNGTLLGVGNRGGDAAIWESKQP
jgi:CHAT domain